MLSPGGARGVEKAELNGTLIQTTTTEAPQGHMYYIGLDVHKKTISYCVKDASGQVHQEGKVGATRWELDDWMKTLPQPWTVAMEATIFTGWIYDHLLPHAQQVKVAHPLMLRAIAAAKKKNDRIDAGKIADCAVTSCRSATWHPLPFAIDDELCATATCWCARWCR
jgi:hypothetical protein